MRGLSSPLMFVARVAPALPSQTPFSPGSGPKSTRPSGRCGVGFAGGLTRPRPPRPVPARRPALRLMFGSGCDAGGGPCAQSGAVTKITSSLLTESRYLAFARGSAQLLTGTGQRHGARIGLIGAILGERSFHYDFIADLHRVARPAGPLEPLRRSHFQSPVSYLPCVVFDIDVEVDVWIHPVDLRNNSFERHGLLRVIFRREGMVRHRRHRQRSETEACGKRTDRIHFHRSLSLLYSSQKYSSISWFGIHCRVQPPDHGLV